MQVRRRLPRFVRILATFCRRATASRASTVAAGCATTTGPGCNSGATGWPVCRSIQGERTEAPGFFLKREGQVDDGVCRGRARSSSCCFVERGSEAKEAKSTLLELIGADTLDKVDFIPYRFKFPRDSSSSSRRISTAGKLRSRSDFGNFLAHQRCRSHNGDAIRLVARAVERATQLPLIGLL